MVTGRYTWQVVLYLNQDRRKNDAIAAELQSLQTFG